MTEIAEPTPIADTFCQDVALMERLGPCTRLTFTVDRDAPHASPSCFAIQSDTPASGATSRPGCRPHVEPIGQLDGDQPERDFLNNFLPGSDFWPMVKAGG
jgi:hypothetical protein